MKHSQLERLLRLAQRTGDRLIVTDAEGKTPVVILSLDEYEALLEGSSSSSSGIPRREGELAEEESVDLERIEAVVEAANREFTEEPSVVPVRAGEEEVSAPPVPELRSRPVARRVQPVEPSEEQFYLEPV